MYLWSPGGSAGIQPNVTILCHFDVADGLSQSLDVRRMLGFVSGRGFSRAERVVRKYGFSRCSCRVPRFFPRMNSG